MEVKKYLCNRCQEWFELLGPHHAEEARCPRCSSEDVREVNACGVETGPPPWEYVCHQCGGRFRVAAPRGPSEEKEIRCPGCESRNIEWLATVSEACPPGG
jgi:DNA-directed RNA polymerase subunit RPC12/RpoP